MKISQMSNGSIGYLTPAMTDMEAAMVLFDEQIGCTTITLQTLDTN